MQIILRILFLGSVFSSSVWGEEQLVDPMRGTSFEQILKDNGDVFLIRIESAKRGSWEEGFCPYDYTASVMQVYRWQGKPSESMPTKMVSFSSASRFRIDDKELIIRNDKTRFLDPLYQKKCQKEVAARLGKEAFLLREDESISVYEQNNQYFAFLPYRYFWSLQPAVQSRKTQLRDNEHFVMLDASDGAKNGDFVPLEALLKPLTNNLDGKGKP